MTSTKERSNDVSKAAQTKVQNIQNQSASNLVPLGAWREEIGRTSATLWRWRRKGWLKVINVAGRLYLSRTTIREFEEKAARGEFSKVHATPGRKAVDQ
jgi:hypothetical protein